MCGIAGILDSKGTTNYQSQLAQMLKAIKHRGPNHTGEHIDEGVAIGMNRLSILDLSASANQPIYSNDGRYMIVYNGEVYNHNELRKRFLQSGYQFQTNSDTEVVLAAFILCGKAMLQEIRGMFAFIIYDKIERTLFGARDHLGIKPFIYSTLGGNFVFCSELKGMLASGLFKKQVICKTSLNTYLATGNTIPPYTMVEGINALRSGYCFRWENGNYQEEPYWMPEKVTAIEETDRSYDETVKSVRNLILQSVEEELMSDVPLGVFQSGGMDSAIVTAAMKICGKKDIKTFTIGFEKCSSDIDERNDAALVAGHFNTDHHSLQVSNRFVGEHFSEYIQGLDQPSCDGLNTFLVCKYAAQEVTVALSGLGGDELFIGYSGFLQYLNRKKEFPFHNFRRYSRNEVLAPLMSDKLYSKLYESYAKDDDVLMYVFLLQRNKEFFNNNVLQPDYGIKDVNTFTSKIIEENYSLSENPITRIKQLYTNQFMGNLLLRDSDAVAMISSLEVRFPMIDIRIVELANSIPATYLIPNINHSGGRNYGRDGWKRVLRDAFVDELPSKLINSNKKGFQLPTNVWLNSSLNEILMDTIHNPSSLFVASSVSKAWQNWKKHPEDWKQVWSILILDRWYKDVFLFYQTI